MNALILLLVLNSTLVLHSGDRIAVEGKPVEKDGVLTFRSGGKLYSLPASEVVRIEEAEAPDAPEKPVVIEAKKPQPLRRRPVSEEERKRLLAELEKNHGGTAPLPPPTLPPAPTREEARELKREESSWRREARFHEEAVRRAREEVELLENRALDLQSKIQFLVAQGYKPKQFTYDTTQLEQTLAQLPYARLEVTRALRAQDQFLEDARREGVLPGWLR
ncbi:MAG TPA: hypothetical protein VFV49_08700 [Thermoanaerobaculia bacterium]|nr:hypothetical protein [Thermoanaerobaculia bacterium]